MCIRDSRGGVRPGLLSRRAAPPALCCQDVRRGTYGPLGEIAMPYRWEDDAYPDLNDREGWTEEELIIAAGRASYLRSLDVYKRQGGDSRKAAMPGRSGSARCRGTSSRA